MFKTFVVVALAMGAAVAWPPTYSPRSSLLVVVDGLALEHVRSGCMPSTAEFLTMRGTKHCRHIDSSMPSYDASTWATLLTGVLPTSHLVFGQHSGHGAMKVHPTLLALMPQYNARFGYVRDAVLEEYLTMRGVMDDDDTPNTDVRLVHTDDQIFDLLTDSYGPDTLLTVQNGTHFVVQFADLRSNGGDSAHRCDVLHKIDRYFAVMRAIIAFKAPEVRRNWMVSLASPRSGSPRILPTEAFYAFQSYADDNPAPATTIDKCSLVDIATTAVCHVFDTTKYMPVKGKCLAK
jgi:hypothetical protein